MNLREVTIGRSSSCDIYLDPRCKYASNVHATIYYDGNQLMFRDNSTNGTMINNISVRKCAVPIFRGDTIMIAGKYPINWNQIDSFFPYVAQQRPLGTVVDTSKQLSQQANSSEPLNLAKWSWGAFVLSWIWGFFNGCWWMFLAKISIFLLTVLFWWIPFAGLLLSLIDFGVSIFFGIKGSEWAWNNRSWTSIADFNHTQDVWNKVGLVLFIVGIASLFLFAIFFATAISRYL